MATAAPFRDQLASVISGGARRVVVDLARVTFMASAGVRVLMGTHRVLAAQGGSLVLVSPSPAAGRVLSLAGVDQVIPVTGSVADAAARWASEGVELPETAQSKNVGAAVSWSSSPPSDPRTTRRIRTVHDCPGGHICPARLASHSCRVREGPGSSLAKLLARPVPSRPSRWPSILAAPGGPCRAASGQRCRSSAAAVPACFPSLRPGVRAKPAPSVTRDARDPWVSADAREHE